MRFEVYIAEKARSQLTEIEQNPAHSKRLKAVGKAIAYLQTNPRHPGLKTHKYSSMIGPNGEEVFEAYAENQTPGAYRIFWCYGPSKNEITILAITPHP